MATYIFSFFTNGSLLDRRNQLCYFYCQHLLSLTSVDVLFLFSGFFLLVCWVLRQLWGLDFSCFICEHTNSSCGWSSLGNSLLWNNMWILHVCPLLFCQRACALFLNGKDKTGTTLFSFSDFQVFDISIYFSSALTQVITIRAPLNDSVLWLPCSFQTVGSSYYRLAATLRAHRGGNTPSVSHVGSNKMRVLTITISRMKMLFTSGELSPLCFLFHRLIVVLIHNRRILSCALEAAGMKPWGEDRSHTASLLLHFHHRAGIYILSDSARENIMICLLVWATERML